MSDARQTHDFRATTAPSPTRESPPNTPLRNEASLGDLVVELTNDLSTLVRQEVDLAKAEVQESVKESAQAGGMVGAGGAVAYAGLLFILAAIAIALGQWLNNYWLGAAIVGLVTGLLGWAILNGGMQQFKQINFVPRKTVHSLERDAALAKEKFS